MVGVGWGVTRYQGGGMWVQVGCFIACDTEFTSRLEAYGSHLSEWTQWRQEVDMEMVR